MQDTIKVYGPKTKEYQRLQAAAMLVNAEFGNNYAEAIVEDVFFDFGGGIKWTTLIIGDHQALDPMQHAKITVGKMADFTEAVVEVMEAHKTHMQFTSALRYGVNING